MKRIGNVIREKRKIKGLKRRQLAKELNVLTGTVYLWENLFFNPDLLSWCILGDLLEIDPTVYQENFDILLKEHKTKEKWLSLICLLFLSLCLGYTIYLNHERMIEKKQGYEFVVSKQWDRVQIMQQDPASFFKVNEAQKDLLLNRLDIDQWVKIKELPCLDRINEIRLTNACNEEIIYIYEYENSTYFSFSKDESVYKINKTLESIALFVQ